MALTLNHYTIRTTDIDTCQHFYVQVLGLTVGPRPGFAFPGAWLYRGDHRDVANAVVHIIGVDKHDAHSLHVAPATHEEAGLQGSGVIDHIAFNANGLASMLAHLNASAVPFRERTVPGIGLHQLFLHDPLGIMVELNYPAAEKAAIDAAGVLAAVAPVVGLDGSIAVAANSSGFVVSPTDAAA